jgi:hypothetical protein
VSKLEAWIMLIGSDEDYSCAKFFINRVCLDEGPHEVSDDFHSAIVEEVYAHLISPKTGENCLECCKAIRENDLVIECKHGKFHDLCFKLGFECVLFNGGH